MIPDITEILLKARVDSHKWNYEKFSNAVELVSNLVKVKIYVEHDYDAGEKWGRVISVDEKIALALIHIEMPLVIVKSEFFCPEFTLDISNIYILEVQNFETESFFIDRQKIEFIFPNAVWEEDIHLESISIQDLWWTTVN